MTFLGLKQLIIFCANESTEQLKELYVATECPKMCPTVLLNILYDLWLKGLVSLCPLFPRHDRDRQDAEALQERRMLIN